MADTAKTWSSMAATAARIAAGGALDEVLSALALAARDALDVPLVAIYLVDRRAQTLSLAAHARAAASPASPEHSAPPPTSLGAVDDPLIHVVSSGQPLRDSEPAGGSWLGFAEIRRLLEPPAGAPAEGAPVRRASLLPIRVDAEAQPAGLLFVAQGDRVLAEWESGLIDFVAAQCAIALRGADLASAAHASTERLTAVNEIGRALISALATESMDALYEVVHREVAKLLEANAFFVALYDEREDLLAFPYVVDDGQRCTVLDQHPGSGPAGAVIHDRRILVLDTLEEVRKQASRHFGDLGRQAASALFVPMLKGDRVMGLVSAQSYREHAYSPEDSRLLSTIADQAAVAIENARLYHEIRNRLQRLLILHEAALAATSSFDMAQVIPEVVGALQRTSGFENVELALLNPRGDRLVVHPASTLPGQSGGGQREISVAAGEGVMGWVVQTGLPARVDDVRADPRYPGASPAVRSALCVPLRVNDRTIGAISVESRQPGAFSLDDEQLMTIVAGQLAPLVDRARLYTETQQRVRELAVLYETSMAIGALADPVAILRAILLHMARAVDASSAYICDWDEEQAAYRTVAEYYAERASARERISDIGQTYAFDDFPIMVQAVRSGRPFQVAVNDPGTELAQREHLREYGGLSSLTIPLLSRQRPLGFVELWESGRERQWTTDEMRLCQTIAVQATAALEKAQLFDETRRRVAELTALQEITTRLTLSIELRDVLEAVTTSVMRLVRPSDVHIYLWNAATESFAFGSALWADGRRTPASTPRPDGLTARVARTAAPVIINDAPGHPLFAGDEQRRWRLHAIAGFPLLHSGEVIGVFTVAFLQDHVFSADELRLLGIFADHASIAVRNARLFEEARQRAAELATLQRSSVELTASLDLRTVLDSITENALRLVQARDVHLYVYDEEQDEFTLGVARWDVNVPHAEVHVPRKEGLTAQVVREHRPVIIDDTQGHAFFSNPEAQRWNIKSIAGFPLMRAERLLGVFNVAFSTPHTFTGDELRVLTLLGDQAAVAIDNARLYGEAQRRAEQVSALLATTAVISSTLDLDTRLQTIADKAKGLTSAEGCTVYSLEDDGYTLRPLVSIHPYQKEVQAFTLRVGEGLTGRVAATGVGEIVNHAENDPRTVQVPGTPVEPECLLSVPLLVQDRVIGVMTVHRAGELEFKQADLDLLSSFASQAAIAIENAKLYQELKVRAQTLQRAYDELAEADRLKDELVQNVSHELRTPLTFIKGYVELLVAGEMGDLSQEQYDSLKIVLSKTDLLVRLVSEVVSLQAISAESLDLAEVRLPDLAQRAMSDVELAAQEAGLQLVLSAEPDTPSVYADPDRIVQVFDNLLGNAIKFSARGGTITVRVFRQGTRVRVEVEDEGIGIPADKHLRVFERFYQVDGSTTRRFGGAGLGLAISKQIMEAHRGEIGVARSEVGHGTTVYFTLTAVPQVDSDQD